jgi:hypothetical protein
MKNFVVSSRNTLDTPPFKKNQVAQAVQLVTGTTDEIVHALHSLGASDEIIAKASVSFLVKIPDALVQKNPGEFRIGNAVLPYIQNVVDAKWTIQKRFQGVMVHSGNDNRMTVVA